MWKRKKSRDTLKFNLKKRKIRELIESILKKNVDIHIGPNTGEYFIIDKHNSVSIMVSHKIVRVANHKYMYDSSFELSFLEDIKKIIKDEIQKRTDSIKKQLFRNEIDLFQKLAEIYKE